MERITNDNEQCVVIPAIECLRQRIAAWNEWAPAGDAATRDWFIGDVVFMDIVVQCLEERLREAGRSDVTPEEYAAVTREVLVDWKRGRDSLTREGLPRGVLPYTDARYGKFLLVASANLACVFGDGFADEVAASLFVPKKTT